MAHIPDGVLSWPVLVGGGALAAAGIGLALRYLDEDLIPRTGLLSAAFFAASLITFPVGPSSIHLLLGALMGLIIGPLTFLAVFVGLLLQALLFGFGGLTALGVNTVNMALPGIVFASLARPWIMGASPRRAGIYAGLCATLSVAATGGLVALVLALSNPDYVPVASVLLVSYVPLMAGEALLTGFTVAFLKRVQPDLLGGAALAEPLEES